MKGVITVRRKTENGSVFQAVDLSKIVNFSVDRYNNKVELMMYTEHGRISNSVVFKEPDPNRYEEFVDQLRLMARQCDSPTLIAEIIINDDSPDKERK